MITISYIHHFVEFHASIAYVLIVLGVIIEGEIVVILAGIFSNLGSLNIYFSFIAAIIGGEAKSVIGYSVGYYLQKNHSGRPILYQAEHRIHYFLPKFTERPFWSIFLSRFLILGLHWFSMIFSGYKKIKINIFAKAEFLSLLVWTVSALMLGYFFSFTALSVGRDVRKFIGIILICFILFFIIEKIIAFIVELLASDNSEDLNK